MAGIGFGEFARKPPDFSAKPPECLWVPPDQIGSFCRFDETSGRAQVHKVTVLVPDDLRAHDAEVLSRLSPEEIKAVQKRMLGRLGWQYDR